MENPWKDERKKSVRKGGRANRRVFPCRGKGARQARGTSLYAGHQGRNEWRMRSNLTLNKIKRKLGKGPGGAEESGRRERPLGEEGKSRRQRKRGDNPKERAKGSNDQVLSSHYNDWGHPGCLATKAPRKKRNMKGPNNKNLDRPLRSAYSFDAMKSGRRSTGQFGR